MMTSPCHLRHPRSLTQYLPFLLLYLRYRTLLEHHHCNSIEIHLPTLLIKGQIRYSKNHSFLTSRYHPVSRVPVNGYCLFDQTYTADHMNRLFMSDTMSIICTWHDDTISGWRTVRFANRVFFTSHKPSVLFGCKGKPQSVNVIYHSTLLVDDCHSASWGLNHSWWSRTRSWSHRKMSKSIYEWVRNSNCFTKSGEYSPNIHQLRYNWW